MPGSPFPLSSLPLVGRSSELTVLGALLDAAGAGRGGTVFLVGEGGVGKTRLATTLADEARARAWAVAVGRAYPVETGVPYAPFADALLPLIRSLDAATVSVLTRGGLAELAALFPTLSDAPIAAPPRGDPSEVKARLLWNIARFLVRLAARRPLLIVLDNLQWADASSLELLHFIARQITSEPLLLLCTYNEAERDQNATLRATEQSLVSLGAAQVVRLAPLSRDATDEMVRRAFGVEGGASREFTALLYGWTRGNPFFIEETLKALVETGRLRERDGTWLGWEVDGFELPRSVRDVIIARVVRLPADARAVADLAAVIGTRASFGALLSVSGLSRVALLSALDELRRQRVLDERADADDVVYDFSHPLLQQTLYAELGLARARLLHGTVAEALEAHYGAQASDHAGELAFHYSRAGAHGLAPKTIAYLAAAGRDALAKNADREAADYLTSALAQIDALPAGDAARADAPRLIEQLARARQRIGEYDAAISLWERAQREAMRAGRPDRAIALERRIGVAHYWSGRYDAALERFAAAIAGAAAAGDDRALAQTRLARGMCLQELGRHQEAQREVEAALVLAEQIGDASLLARVHRGLLLLYAWTGPVDVARAHGERAIALAQPAGELSIVWSAHWALAVLAGITGNGSAVAVHLPEAERLAEALRSPLLRAWTAEIRIEYAAGAGEWESAVALGERTIALARMLGQRALLARVLVWTALLHLGRGDHERGKRYVDEAWEISEAGRAPSGRPLDVHTVVPAHTGLAAYHLAIGDHQRAIAIGEAGLEIADRTGYVVWAIHRLLPVIAESALWSLDLDRAARLGERIRRDSARLGHRLGLAWADACDALVVMVAGDRERAVQMLRTAIAQLESVPFVGDAARVRRQLARVLAQIGDRDEALRELRLAHDTFAKLGAATELEATRGQLRELGARPPVRAPASGAHGLTGREVEIVRLVAARKSNKEIASVLGISPRTVSTHLSNIFGKVSVSSRGELADFARRTELPRVQTAQEPDRA